MNAPTAFDYEAVTWGGGDVVQPNRSDFLDHSLHLRYALEALREIRGSVIEVGCGSGRFIASVAAARPDLTAFGCDVSESALAVARTRQGVSFQKGEAEALPYADGQFAAVLMIDVLEHLPEIDRGLREVRRVLAPGGPFHLVFPCEGNRLTLHGIFKPLHLLKRRHAGHLQRLSPWALRRHLRQNGLEPVRWRYSYHFLGQLYDAMVFGALGLGFDLHGARREHVESGRPGALFRIRRAVSTALYFESRWLARSPTGMTLHVTCR